MTTLRSKPIQRRIGIHRSRRPPSTRSQNILHMKKDTLSRVAACLVVTIKDSRLDIWNTVFRILGLILSAQLLQMVNDTWDIVARSYLRYVLFINSDEREVPSLVFGVPVSNTSSVMDDESETLKSGDFWNGYMVSW